MAERPLPPVTPRVIVPAAGAAGSRVRAFKRAVVGRPLASGQMDTTLVSKKVALPIFASDPLSSVAYATEAALVVLVAASASAASLVVPISIAIAGVMAIVVLSYTQTVQAYQTSGGAYVVARENLGTIPSLVAAGALLVDYVLTVAVSVAAGVVALASAVPTVGGHRVELSLAFIAVLTLANLRGVREAGILFALPTYAFVAALFATIAAGLGTCAVHGCPQAAVPDPLPPGTGHAGIAVVLGAFASGAAALTGVESISNGVGAFREPRGRNAATTLLVMGAIAITLFLGVSYLAVATHARPSGEVSIVSEIARAVFPGSSATSPMYYAVQGLTLAILVLAANTSYQGFPRLAAVLAGDRYFPRQFVNVGDRLVYSNGIVVLAALASLLIVVFHANVIALIHLYVIGVFTAFTISQAGMVRHWLRGRAAGWQAKALMNGAGAVATGVVDAVVIEAKFLAGAWMVVVAVPVLVASFFGIRRHYALVGRRLHAGAAAVEAAPEPRNSVLVVDRANPAARLAEWYAHRVRAEAFATVPARPSPPGATRVAGGLAAASLDRHERDADMVLEQVWSRPHADWQFLTVVVPEYYERPSLISAAAAHRSTAALRRRLRSEPGVVVTSVPLVAGERADPERVIARVLVSSVQGASLLALRYAQSLALPDTRAVSVVYDDAERRQISRQWAEHRICVPLDVVDAPYRDLGDAVVAYARELTADPRIAVSVVIPELVFPRAARLLHGQHSLYIKRRLLFETRVFLTTVPYEMP